MRMRDIQVVAALRSALSALANAEAVAGSSETDTTAVGSVHFAGAESGLGAAEIERLSLTEEQELTILSREVAELSAHVERLRRLCRFDEADATQRALEVLTRVIDPDET